MSNPYARQHVAINRSAVCKWVMKNNLTQAEVARRIGTSPSYFSQLVTGRRFPNPAYRARIQKVLHGMDWNQIFSVKTNGR